MLLDGELVDRGDASVVDLDFVDRLRRLNPQTNGNQGEREAGFVSEKNVLHLSFHALIRSGFFPNTSGS
jgi:hypothetical protein